MDIFYDLFAKLYILNVQSDNTKTIIIFNNVWKKWSFLVVARSMAHPVRRCGVYISSSSWSLLLHIKSQRCTFKMALQRVLIKILHVFLHFFHNIEFILISVLKQNCRSSYYLLQTSGLKNKRHKNKILKWNAINKAAEIRTKT